MACNFIFGLWVSMILAQLMIQLSVGCFREEKNALLEFKASINKTQNGHLLLPSWDGHDIDEDNRTQNDCCDWVGVKCSNSTGRITELSLSFLNIAYSSDWFLDAATFIPLKQLRFLDLSYNNFQSEVKGCGQLSRLKNLKVLHLDGNDFNNSILNCLSAISTLKNLSLATNSLRGIFSTAEELATFRNLVTLDLSKNQLSKALAMEAMSSLKSLSFSYNNLSDFSIFQGICKLRNLLELDLSNNILSGALPLCLSNLTFLRVLDLSNNNFVGSIPSTIITNLIYLEYLSLSNNPFEGSFSFSYLANHSNLEVFKLVPLGFGLQVDTESPLWFPPFQLKFLELPNCNLNNQTRTMPSFLQYQNELRLVDLSHNKLVGKFPGWMLENNMRLEIVKLTNNSFTGPFHLPNIPLPFLISLDISNNEITSQLPKNTGTILPNMRFLNMSRNILEGSIPASLGNMSVSSSIDLSNNKLSGEVPEQIFMDCTSLEVLKLSNNSLHGPIFSSNMSLTQLKFLYLDDNNFVGKIQHGISGSSLLLLLDISNNMISGELPSWIGNLSSLQTLVISKNFLEGTIPNDVCKLKMLSFLDLSRNKLFGSIPSCSNLPSLRFMHLHKNGFTGLIPSTISRSSNLVTLDLRNNQLSGIFPNWIGKLSYLKVLLLGGNHLQGQITEQVCQLKKLSIMDLSKNSFSGLIPPCLSTLPFGREVSRHNEYVNTEGAFSNTKPLSTYKYDSSIPLNQVVIMRNFIASNEQEEVEFTTKSRTYSYGGLILNFMSGLDLSCNQLTGQIPIQLGELSKIQALNLSHNLFNGSIPVSFAMLKEIESLDLSYNSLSGIIPSQLDDLNNLAIFNVSYNNLSGKIPERGQFATFDERNYEGNLGLCGPQLKRCYSSTIAPSINGRKNDMAIDMEDFYWSFMGSYIIGLSAVLAILLINHSWCKIWFHFINVRILPYFISY